MRVSSQVRGYIPSTTSKTRIVSALIVAALMFLFGTPAPANAQTNYVLTSRPSSIVFSYTIGAAAPATQSLTIDDTTPHALPFTVSTDQSWITTSATSSKTKAILQFGVNPAGLAAGIYSGRIFITAGIVVNSPLAIPVVLTVTGGTVPRSTLSASPSGVAFGNINVGAAGSQSITLSNTGSASVTISQATVAGTGFTISGVPTTISAGSSASFSAKFAPLVAGNSTGSISLVSNAANSTMAIALTGSGVQVQPGMSATPSSASFGNVTMGQSSTQMITLTNTGNANLTISQVITSGTGITASIISTSMPMAVGVQQTALLSVKFAPTTLGAVAGSVSVMSNASNSPATIPVSGTGVQTTSNYVVSSTPSSFVFSYKTGAAAPTTQSATIDDTTPHALPFTVSTDQPWITTSATASKTKAILQFGVNPSGMAAGIYSGHIFITASIVSNSPLAVPIVLTVTGGSTTSTLSASPTSLAFGNINVGNSATKTTLITNTGTVSVTISQVNVAGAGITASGIATPLTLTAGQTTVLTVAFAPLGSGAVTGSASVVSDATNSPMTITTSGAGVQPQLTASPTSFNFGNVNVNSSGSKIFTISNSGSSSLTISQASISGTGFTMSGLTTPTTLGAGLGTSFSVQFAPLSSGGATGTVILTSNSPNSPTTIALSGTGVALAAHSVSLSWTASSSTVSGYNVYVSSVPGGPYTLLNTGLVGGTSYSDSTVQSGKTYFYVVMAVDANGVESVASNEVSVIIP